MTIKPWGDRDLPTHWAMQAEIDELRAALDAWEKQEPVGYIAWHEGAPSWDEDCVCQDAVYPVDESDVRTSEPIYTKPKDATITK